MVQNAVVTAGGVEMSNEITLTTAENLKKIVNNNTNWNGKAAPKAAPAPVSTAPEFWTKTAKGYDFDVVTLYDRFKADGVIYAKFAGKECLCRVVDNIISEIKLRDLLQLVSLYIGENADVSKAFSNKAKQLINEYNIGLYIHDKEIEPLRDTKAEARFVFANKYVCVRADKIELKDLKELPGPVWESQIIDHEIKDCLQDRYNKSPFYKFLQNICTNPNTKQLDSDRHFALQCSIGYLMHTAKPINKFALILCEDNTDGTPNGGTGKGLIIKSISKMRNVVTIDTKNSDFKSRFLYQKVTSGTQVLLFDDVPARFDFEHLFSMITDGINIERKNQLQVNISAELGPKVAITSNYALRGSSDSHERRKYEMELFRFYNLSHTPLDDFPGGFFDNWNASQWNDFYWVMLDCVQTYLKRGIDMAMPPYASETLIFNKLKNEIGNNTESVIKYFDKLPRNKELICSNVYKDLGMPAISPFQLGKLLKLYCDSYNLRLYNHTKKIDKVATRYYIIRT